MKGPPGEWRIWQLVPSLQALLQAATVLMEQPMSVLMDQTKKIGDSKVRLMTVANALARTSEARAADTSSESGKEATSSRATTTMRTAVERLGADAEAMKEVTKLQAAQLAAAETDTQNDQLLRAVRNVEMGKCSPPTWRSSPPGEVRQPPERCAPIGKRAAGVGAPG